MTAILRDFWKFLIGRDESEAQATPSPVLERARQVVAPTIEIAPNDPIIAYFQSAPNAVEIHKLELASPAVGALRTAGVQLVVPLVNQGELIGLINLGPRLSEQDYSTDDRRLLDNLASQAAPAVRVAQLVRQQQAEIRTRERIEQELRVAQRIQQTLLPKALPTLAGWQVAAHYQPARAVGGDFYDFIDLPDGRLGLVVGDVTDKGVPAALVMATTRTLLRAVAQRLDSPGEVLERVNEILCNDIPPNMFVTCLYAILDPDNGHLNYANAGHDPPYQRTEGGLQELRATGMPLGLLPGMVYEEKETTLAPGESVLFYSDGLVEAHNPGREMFSFPRLRRLMAAHPGGAALIDFLLAELAEFTGPDWEQEDDVTFVTLERVAAPVRTPDLSPDPTVSIPESGRRPEERTPRSVKGGEAGGEGDWQPLAEFSFPSEPGNERIISEQVATVIADSRPDLPARRLERLKTAVAEATMNAIEHGNRFRPEMPVSIQVLASEAALAVRITDHGQGASQPIPTPETPDLEAKLAGLQTPRGWGLFLIEKMVDEMHVTSDEDHHTIELILYLEGDDHATTAI